MAILIRTLNTSHHVLKAARLMDEIYSLALATFLAQHAHLFLFMRQGEVQRSVQPELAYVRTTQLGVIGDGSTGFIFFTSSQAIMSTCLACQRVWRVST